MQTQFLKKEALALSFVANFLLTHPVQTRLPTVKALSLESKLSVGSIQNALSVLEANQSVIIKKQGRKGSFLESVNMDKLLKMTTIQHLVCVMPLPYDPIYHALASAIKEQLASLPIYFAHMRGSDSRINCLIDGVYHIAITSKLAACTSLQRELFEIAATFEPMTFTKGHKLIFRKGEFDFIKKVARDPSSGDQKLLSDLFFEDNIFKEVTREWGFPENKTFSALRRMKNVPIEYIDIPYHDMVTGIINKEIDAGIWQVSALSSLEPLGLDAIDFPHEGVFKAASQAVLLIRKGDVKMKKILETFIDIFQISVHQDNVVNGVQIARY